MPHKGSTSQGPLCEGRRSRPGRSRAGNPRSPLAPGQNDGGSPGAITQERASYPPLGRAPSPLSFLLERWLTSCCAGALQGIFYRSSPGSCVPLAWREALHRPEEEHGHRHVVAGISALHALFAGSSPPPPRWLFLSLPGSMEVLTGHFLPGQAPQGAPACLLGRRHAGQLLLRE